MEFPRPTKNIHHEPYPAIHPTNPALSVKGKTIFITGGGSSIGAAIAKAFATAGASKIAITGRTEKALLATKEAVEDGHKDVMIIVFAADVTDQAAIAHAFTTIGTVDILVNCAGCMPDIASIKDADLDDWWTAFNTNVKGSFIISQAFLRVASTNAIVINISAGMVHVETLAKGFSSYISSKTAGAKFFQLLQVEQPELRIMNVHPGIIQSGMLKKMPFMKGEDDVELPASFVVWACSPDAEFLKGKFVWANWDVEELKAREAEISDSDFLTLGLDGWPFHSRSKPISSKLGGLFGRFRRYMCV